MKSTTRNIENQIKSWYYTGRYTFYTLNDGREFTVRSGSYDNEMAQLRRLAS